MTHRGDSQRDDNEKEENWKEFHFQQENLESRIWTPKGLPFIPIYDYVYR
jgi:hypothetical protein